MTSKPSLLFLCTGNSCRSQMAEGLCRHLRGHEFFVASAGIETHGLNPNAVKVMAEIGIDISGHTSKTVDDLCGAEFDAVITVCDSARETCPYIPAKTVLIHLAFDDPPALASSAESEAAALGHYRRVRDEIHDFVLDFAPAPQA